MIKLMQTIVGLEERIKKLEELMFDSYEKKDPNPTDEIKDLIYSSHDEGISHRDVLRSSTAQKNNLKAKDIQEIIKKLADGCCIVVKRKNIGGSRQSSKVYFKRNLK